VAPAARPGLLVPEDLTPLHRHGELGWQEARLTLRGDEEVLRCAPGLAALEAIRAKRAPIGADLERGFRFDEPVVTPKAHAAAVLPGAAGVLDELEAEDLDRMLDLAHLGRLRREIPEDMGIAVEAVGPWARAPRGHQEVHLNERREVGVVPADEHAGRTAVRGLPHPAAHPLP